jgi:hypothetical protein
MSHAELAVSMVYTPRVQTKKEFNPSTGLRDSVGVEGLYGSLAQTQFYEG